MNLWYHNVLDNTRYMIEVPRNRVTIGRSPGNDVVLNSPFVAGEAVVLYRRAGAWELMALGMNGLQVGDREIRGGERATLDGTLAFKIFPYTLTIEGREAVQSTAEERRRSLDDDLSKLISGVHYDLLERMGISKDNDRSVQVSDDSLLALERNVDEIASARRFLDKPKAALLGHCAGQSVRAHLLNQLINSAGQAGRTLAWEAESHWSRLVSAVPEREDDLHRASERAAALLNLESVADLTEQINRVEREYWPVWEAKVGAELYDDFRKYLALRYLKKEVKDIVFGYGPLEDLLRTPTISEIMVVDREHIYAEKNGVLENTGRRFVSDDVTLAIIDRIVSKVGRRIDKSSPLVDARLTDGSRVNAVIPPLAVSGPCLTIRKFPARKLQVDDLIERRSLTRTVAEFLHAAVLCRKNVLISGGTGSGKTTLLNCLSDFIPDKERIVTIEDTAELQLKKEHVVRLETKESNIEGKGAYTIRDLVKNALRMRPDRIVVGECRGPEALDMLQAMNTGHDGSLTTIHANSAADVILRLEVLVQMAADLPIDSIHRQIASAIDLVVQLRRLHDGTRRIVQVTEIVDVDEARGGLRTKDLFLLEGAETQPALNPTGALPTFMGDLITAGNLKLETFYR